MSAQPKIELDGRQGVHAEKKEDAESALVALMGVKVDSKKMEYYKNQLTLAYAANRYELQCKVLLEYAQYLLSCGSYDGAAKLLNGALAICRRHLDHKHSKELEQLLLTELLNLENVFLKKELNLQTGKDLSSFQNNLRHKELSELRAQVKKSITEVELIVNDSTRLTKMRELFRDINQKIKAMLKHMLEDCVGMMQTLPPCQYALIGTGSLAREEMTPFSDLECFILIKDDTPAIKEYFKKLSCLFELQIINLGETSLHKALALLPMSMPNPVPKGFSLDIHKKPNSEDCELIATPEMLVSYQDPKNFVHKPGNHLSSSLINATFIGGTGEELLLLYLTKIREILSGKCAENDAITLGKQRAVMILRGDLDKFKPNFEQLTEGVLFQVKEDFYRLPHIVVDAIAMIVEFKNSATWDRIEELVSHRIFSEQAGIFLKLALSSAIFLRLRVYSHYGFQCEVLDTLQNPQIALDPRVMSSDLLYSISDKNFDILNKIYKTIIPLHNMAVLLCENSGDLRCLVDVSLFDTTFFTAGLIARRLCRHREAILFFKQALKKNECLESGKMASCHLNLGSCFTALGNMKKAIIHHGLAYDITKKVYSRSPEELALYLNNLGRAYCNSTRPEKAIIYLQNALQLMKQNKKQTNLSAVILTNLGMALESLGQYEKASQCHQNAFAIGLEIFGDQHPQIGIYLNNVGGAFLKLQNYYYAKCSFESALEIGIKAYGPAHPKVANRLSNMGSVLENLGNFERAIQYYKHALLIDMNIYGPTANHVAICCNNLAGAYLHCKRPRLAIKYQKKAFAISVKNGDVESQIYTLNVLGGAFLALKQYKEAIYEFRKAVFVLFGYNNQKSCHPLMINILVNLSAACYLGGDREQALVHIQNAFKFASQIYNANNPIFVHLLNALDVLKHGKDPITNIPTVDEELSNNAPSQDGKEDPEESFFSLLESWDKAGNESLQVDRINLDKNLMSVGSITPAPLILSKGMTDPSSDRKDGDGGVQFVPELQTQGLSVQKTP